MSSTVGNVAINMRVNLTQFKEGMREANTEASLATRRISRSAQEGFGSVRSQLGLLDNSIRGAHAQAMADLVRMFSQSEIVMKALPIGAVAGGFLLIGGVVVEMIAKVREFWKSLDELSAAEKKHYDDLLKKAQTDLEFRTKILQAAYDLKIAEAKDDTEKQRLKVEMYSKLVAFNKQYIGQLQEEKKHLEDLANAQQKAADLATSRAMNLGGSSTGAAGGAGAAFGLEAFIDEKKANAARTKLTELAKTIAEANAALQTTQARSIDAGHALETGVAASAKKTTDSIANMRKEIQGLFVKVSPQQSPLDKIFEDAQNAEVQIRKMAAENPALFRKAFPNDSVETVVAAMRRLATQAEDTEFQKALDNISKTLNSLPSTLPNLVPFTPSLPTLAPGAKVPSSAQEELSKIKTDQKAAADEARQVIDSIQTQNEKYEDQKAILEELRRQGLITEQQLKQAQEKARESLDKTSESWKRFGADIGDTIKQAILFGRSWTDALKAILVELVQVILKMTLLKQTAGSAGGGGGIGGFLGSFFGGLFGGHKAAGGPVSGSQFYLVGENGPELFAPGVSGTIVPNSALAGGGPQVVYNIDARGADIGVEQRIMSALRVVEDRAVVRSVATINEIQRRHL